jgi:glucosamine--fructose-6-phosphate aminotransferase (isomerizing)
MVEQLRRLEYRGYDSAGVVVLDRDTRLVRERVQGKVRDLASVLHQHALLGHVGLGHTRWATHGVPSVANAHPHVCRNQVALVHNGIIENHAELRAAQADAGHRFTSETDTEVIVHSVYDRLQEGKHLLQAVRETSAELHGAYALGVIRADEPHRLVAARFGSPLVVGLGENENFVASDVNALIPFTRDFIFLEDGDFAELTPDEVRIFDAQGQRVERAIYQSGLTAAATDKGPYAHYMLKEIYEQPQVVADLLEGRLHRGRVLEAAFGPTAGPLFDRVRAVQIVACGTSYHAGQVARNWFEGLAGLPCRVEVASEFRYRHPVPAPDTLFVTISQSGETADTLAALRAAKALGFGPSLAIVNAPESSLVRDSDLVLMTRAGPEIGVASTKAFTSQLTALLMLVLVVGRRHRITDALERNVVSQLERLPAWIEETLQLDDALAAISSCFADKEHALFLGRGVQYPIAREGALKLKEVSYIHAEAYPAGELKHGPLALVDARMPVIAVAPKDDLLEKLKSNLEEVRARGGELFVFADAASHVAPSESVHVIEVPSVGENVTPIVFTVPLQLLAYHVALIKGTDVDQPRNLAKSVTVE